MARYGYILHSADDATVRNIEESGCCRIFRECRYDTQTRPERRTLLRQIGNNDEIIVPQLCHIVNGCSNLAVLLEYCEVRNIRLVSIGDRIDTAGILYDGESDRNIVSAFKTLASDVADIKKGNGEKPLQTQSPVQTSAKERRTQRDSRVISMYLTGLNTGEILRLNNISKTTLFRVLRKHGIPTVRLGKKHSICK